METLRTDDPTTLGPFDLRGRLGAGGMGVVYLGHTGDTEVAVKTVARGVGDEVRERLRREAAMLQTIDHPRIARFVDADPDADEPWLAMRYVAGPSLSEAGLPLPPQQLRQLADGLAEALAALHKLGVTHRDVKPGNIIMTTHGAVLVDLGIAVTADASSMTMTGTAVGSPAWMAPEQFAGDPAGPPTDVWGWAAVLTYAATAREPFGTGTLGALAHRILAQPPNLQDLPDWLLAPVQASFAKRPQGRPRAEDLMRGGRARISRVTLQRRAAPTWASAPGMSSGHPSAPQNISGLRGSAPTSGPVRQPRGPMTGPHGQSYPGQTPYGSGPVPVAGRPPIRPARRSDSLVWTVSVAVIIAAVITCLAVAVIVATR